MIEELIDELQEEADLCRNETADDIANLLDKAVNELKKFIWQPIDTAPRDGTVIDLWHKDYGRICDTWWDDSFWVALGTGDEKFTHWMPLPEPPK